MVSVVKNPQTTQDKLLRKISNKDKTFAGGQRGNELRLNVIYDGHQKTNVWCQSSQDAFVRGRKLE